MAVSKNDHWKRLLLCLGAQPEDPPAGPAGGPLTELTRFVGGGVIAAFDFDQDAGGVPNFNAKDRSQNGCKSVCIERPCHVGRSVTLFEQASQMLGKSKKHGLGRHPLGDDCAQPATTDAQQAAGTEQNMRHAASGSSDAVRVGGGGQPGQMDDLSARSPGGMGRTAIEAETPRLWTTLLGPCLCPVQHPLAFHSSNSIPRLIGAAGSLTMRGQATNTPRCVAGNW